MVLIRGWRTYTCHGRLHVHHFWTGAEDAVDLPQAIRSNGYRDQFAACARDLQVNGATYISEMRQWGARHE